MLPPRFTSSDTPKAMLDRGINLYSISDSDNESTGQPRINSPSPLSAVEADQAMDIENEPFDLLPPAVLTEAYGQLFDPKELSCHHLADTSLTAQPYSINIVTSFLSNNDALLLTDELNSIQRKTITYQQLYNQTYIYLCSTPMKIFSTSNRTNPPCL